MIKNKTDLKNYITEDCLRYGIDIRKLSLKQHLKFGHIIYLGVSEKHSPQFDRTYLSFLGRIYHLGQARLVGGHQAVPSPLLDIKLLMLRL